MAVSLSIRMAKAEILATKTAAADAERRVQKLLQREAALKAR